MPASNDGPTSAKATQTELELVLAGKTSFVTPRPALSDDTRIAQAFEDLRARIRSPTWRPALLIVLGHDSAKRQDELEQRIREDEAAEVVDGGLQSFFDDVLAPVMQDRETKLVNTMQECVQHELRTQQLVIQRQEKRIAVLTQQIEDLEKQAVHLKTKVDRRVNENNALRKEQYRQLLMLRDVVSKHASEPGALSALNEAIATVLTGKQEGQAVSKTANGDDPDHTKPTVRGLNSSSQVLQREKEKWEERAREASLESQELREKISRLMQENKTFRTHATMPWFLDPESAIAERQRVAEAVCSSQGKWEDVGDALAELLNNDLLWAAVEQSARRGGKRRVARGLEAMLAQMDNREQTPVIQEYAASPQDEVAVMPLLSRRRSTFAELRRLLPCRVCNGAGYVQSELGDNGASDSDSYLRKTLEQVLELKQQIEKTNTKALALEGELELARSHSAQLQERLLQAELVKSTAVDSCLQTDLDDEEGIDLDEIMRSAYGQDGSTPKMSPRQNRRNAQYEHLIVELKSTLADKDEGLVESRKALEVAQTRAVKLQRALQKEKDTHEQELAMLKTSLSFSLKSRNNKIEERQTAVRLLLKKFVKKTQQASLLRKSNDSDMAPMGEEGTGEGSDSDSDNTEENQADSGDCALPELNSAGPTGEQREVKRMESLVQRYAEDIVRVRKEHEVQQERLKKAEVEIAEESEKRSRTNSITQGSLVVSLASHPRDLFKALTTAQSDILALRRASQRSSALQTDRLLTLTTHLSHMSEELCSLRKRNLAEVEFWKLECEKLQNTNKALEAQQQLHQRELQVTRDHHAELSEDAALGVCSMCEKHKSRLMMISNQLLRDVQTPRTDPEVEVPIVLTESERKTISSVLLDLESTYLGMSSAKQQVARELIAAHIGTSLTPRTSRSGKSRSNSKVMLSPLQNAGIGGFSPSPTKSVSSSPRKSMRSFGVSKSKRDLKKLTETEAREQETTQPSPRVTQNISQELTDEQKSNSDAEITATSEPADVQEGVYQARHRKTLVQEILDEGGFTLTKHGLAIDTPTPEAPAPSAPLDKAPDNNDGPRLIIPSPSNTNPYDEAQDDQEISNDDDMFPYEDAITLLDCPNNTERDSDVIDQLRGLINQASAAKERLAISGWKILISRILCSWTHQRLRQLKFICGNRVKTNADGTIRLKSHKIASICSAMEKAVKFREISLQESESTRESLRKFHRTAQARLIHGVSMLLENLSRNGKLTTSENGILYIPQVSSPRRSPTSNRSLYPAATVHLNHVPPTQQIPTSTFPALTSSNSLSGAPRDQLTPNSSRYREGPEEGFSYGEGYHLPHRLIKSAGPRGMGSFVPAHSTVHTLLGSMPLAPPARNRRIGEQNGHTMAGNTAAISMIEPQRPVRPHSSPAGPRLLSTRLHELTSVADTRSSNTGDGGL